MSDSGYKLLLPDEVLDKIREIEEFVAEINPDGGVCLGETSAKTYEWTFGESQDIPLPTRAGYSFTGWNISEQPGNCRNCAP